MIEDTSFVIDLLRGTTGAIETLEWLEANRVPEKLSSVPVMDGGAPPTFHRFNRSSV